jgi:serine/threonine protein kinase
MSDLDRRATIFPRSKPDYWIHTPPKRALTEQELDRKPNGGSAKLRRMAPINTDGLSFSRKVFRKEAEDPWKRYRKVLQFDQASPALLVHRNDDSFWEFIVKEVKVNNKEWLQQVRDASHKNIVHLHKALYNDKAIFFIYKVIEVLLAQVFATLLGQLRHYEVSAFCFELLHGLDYIHNILRLVHGNINAGNVLLAINGIVKIG